jgi:hypothetical protein
MQRPRTPSNCSRAIASLAALVSLESEETIVRLEMNAAKWEKACACGKTPRACSLAARRAAGCRELAKRIRAECRTNPAQVMVF